MRRTNKDRTEATRQLLLDHARALFVDRGYGETATPDIVEAAGVTRGALYHHFADKKALFAAVAQREAAQVAADIENGAVEGADARSSLLAGASAYFDAMAVPGRSRLLLLEAPAVLGIQGAMALDRQNAEARLKDGLEAFLRDAGQSTGLLEPLTALFSAAFDRAALEIEAGGDRAVLELAIARLIDGLVSRPQR